MNHRRHLTKGETVSSPCCFRSSYLLLARLGQLSSSFAVDKPHRNVHGLEIIRLQRFRPEIRQVLRQQGSDETFAHASYRSPGCDVPNRVILGEGKRKSWVSYVKDQRPEPKRVNWP